MQPDEQIPESVDKEIAKTVPPTKKAKGQYVPSYAVIGSQKIPVSSSHGKLWKARRDQGKHARRELVEAWEEAVDYFNHDQMKHRKNTGGQVSGVGRARYFEEGFTETENVVFTNTTTLVNTVYSRNPSVEMTTENEGRMPLATCAERLTNTLFTKRTAPGINLKPKAKKAVTIALLTNHAYIKIGYTLKSDSSEQALNDLKNISERLAKAKNTKEIEQIEGELAALEQQIDLLMPSGPYAKLVHPKNLIVDPDSKESDHSDANWMMECDYLSTDYLRARFTTATDRMEERKSIYEPTHVVLSKTQSQISEDINNFTIFNKDSGATQYGYDDDEAYRAAQRTKVWYVWDKITRRVFMYNDKDWTWPIWVWEDPLKLEEFFPYYSLTFYENPNDTVYSKGEVSYYLDQQDAINEINSEERAARRWAKRNVFFDNESGLSKEDVEAVLKGEDGTARGVSVPEGKKMSDVIFSIVPPGAQFSNLFNKQSKFEAISKLSSVSEFLNGGQFKTNTTNDAISAYGAAANIRIDSKTDAIEDFIGMIGWGVTQLCLQFMSQQEVAYLIGDAKAQAWENLPPEQIQQTFCLRTIGGTSQKPTSAAKKKEAIEVGQVLGQFAKISPIALIIAIEMLEKSFDEINIKEEHWAALKKSIEQSLAPQGGPEQPQGQPQQGAPQEGEEKARIKQEIDSLPPEMKQQLAAMIQQGVSPAQALEQVKSQSQQQ